MPLEAARPRESFSALMHLALAFSAPDCSGYRDLPSHRTSFRSHIRFIATIVNSPHTSVALHYVDHVHDESLLLGMGFSKPIATPASRIAFNDLVM